MRAVLTCLALMLALSPAVAAPAPPRSDIDIKSRSAEITVDVDEKLRAYPDIVADCLAEGRRWAVKSRAEAEKARKEEPILFTVARRWTYERIYSFRSVVAGRYVSILRHDGTFSGGAHPNSRTDTILWDRQTKRRISLRPFFNETADGGPTMTALAAFIRREASTAKLARMNENEKGADKDRRSPEEFAAQDEWTIKHVQPRLTGLGPITLAPSSVPGKSSGLTIHFSRYDIDAYAAGEYTVFVPWSAFLRYLSPEGMTIFSGTKPQEDIDDN